MHDNEPLAFATREEFRVWLGENGQTSEGVWLRFGKAGGPETLTAAEALEEALCFAWMIARLDRNLKPM